MLELIKVVFFVPTVAVSSLQDTDESWLTSLISNNKPQTRLEKVHFVTYSIFGDVIYLVVIVTWVVQCVLIYFWNALSSLSLDQLVTVLFATLIGGYFLVRSFRATKQPHGQQKGLGKKKSEDIKPPSSHNSTSTDCEAYFGQAAIASVWEYGTNLASNVYTLLPSTPTIWNSSLKNDSRKAERGHGDDNNSRQTSTSEMLKTFLDARRPNRGNGSVQKGSQEEGRKRDTSWVDLAGSLKSWIPDLDLKSNFDYASKMCKDYINNVFSSATKQVSDVSKVAKNVASHKWSYRIIKGWLILLVIILFTTSFIFEWIRLFHEKQAEMLAEKRKVSRRFCFPIKNNVNKIQWLQVLIN